MASLLTSENLARHPFFVEWRDPESGVMSYLLNERVAPLQKAFYFVNTSVSGDGGWLWFEAAHPPAGYKYLAAVSLNADNPEILAFPQASISLESPLLHDDGQGVWLVVNDREPAVHSLRIDGSISVVGRLLGDYLCDRPVNRISTHLTRSADGRFLLLDGNVGNRWFIGTMEIETGEVRILREFSRKYNHAQFHPTDAERFMLAQDWWIDTASGRFCGYDLRIWLMDREGKNLEPLGAKDYQAYCGKGSHEWWSADGMVCWVDYDLGVFECGLDDRQAVHVWRKPLCHAHCSMDRKLFVADQGPYKWNERPCEVLFLDRESGKERAVVSAMPCPPVPRGRYHLDPHPRFVCDDSAIVYTTMVRGKVDVAVAPVADVLHG